jgi:hypothetical protein
MDNMNEKPEKTEKSIFRTIKDNYKAILFRNALFAITVLGLELICSIPIKDAMFYSIVCSIPLIIIDFVDSHSLGQ